MENFSVHKVNNSPFQTWDICNIASFRGFCHSDVGPFYINVLMVSLKALKEGDCPHVIYT